MVSTGYIPEKSLAKFHTYYAVVDMGYTSPCWIWKKALKHSETVKTPFNGYGQFWFKEYGKGPSKNHRAHRAAYIHYRGEIKPGFELDHQCNIEACANPWHTEQVTGEVNLQRKYAAIRAALAVAASM